MTPIYRATSDLVAVAWLKTVDGIDIGSVGTTLPKDSSSWETYGFIQVQVGGGTPNVDLPIAAPVMTLHGWANNASSKKVPWGKANNLLELVRDATYDPVITHQYLDLPSSYPPVRVMGVEMLTEPRRVDDDPSNYAHYIADIHLHWVKAPEVTFYLDMYEGAYA